MTPDKEPRLGRCWNRVSRSFRQLQAHSLLLLFVISCIITTSNGAQYWRRLGPIPDDMQIGTTCKSTLHCLLFIPHSHCDWESRTCGCQPYHVQQNSSTCLPASLLGFSCSVDAQCTLKVPNSQCLEGRCQCKSNFMSYRRDKCLPPAKIGGFCLNDHQCTMNDKYSNCKYIIPRVYGKCRCPAGYIESSDGKCLPGLRKRCDKDEECEAGTANSFCKLPSYRSSFRTKKNSKESICSCKPGFRENRLTCEAPPTTTTSTTTTTTTTTTSTTTPPPLPTPIVPSFNFSEATSDMSMVSLGKSCRSSIECQVRDPYSICRDGICECLSPSSKCSSQNTGCLNDTFQCKSGQCISWYFVCDKNKNCDDGSDEEDCGGNGRKCPKEAFECDDGSACLSRASVCNGRMECPDGSDEARCYKGIKCDPNSFQCQSGQCLPQYTFCNAVIDCNDGSDELESVCENARTCPKGTFQCSSNNRCRSTAILCSGVDGCGDNSDEDRCDVCYCEKPGA